MNGRNPGREAPVGSPARVDDRPGMPPSQAMRLRPDTPIKPDYMHPCNGCGVCCHLEPCAIAREYIPGLQVGPCAALEYEDGRFLCGMIRHPGRYMGLPNDWADGFIGSLFAEALGVGRGCDATV